MKIHLAWIRVTAAAAIVAGVGVYPAAAQYAPYRPIPKQPAAPQAAAPQPAATQPYGAPAGQTPYLAYRPQAPQQAPVARYQTPTAPYQAPVAQYPQSAAAYPQTAAAYPQPTPAYPQRTAAYPQATTPYPQTAAQYPTNWNGYPYVAQQPNEAPAAPANGAHSAAPSNGAQHGEMPAPADPNGHANANGNGYQAGCNCNGGYAAGDAYSAGACGCNGTYPDYGISGYCDDSCHENQWFGGAYFLFMERDNATPVKLTVEVDHAAVVEPYYPPATATVVSTHQTDHDFREGVEVRFGSTFTIGESCDTCDTGCNSYGYNGCNSCSSCTPPTVFAWEFAWWGIDDDAQMFTFEDMPTTRIYGMKNFVGLEYDRDAGAAFAYDPVNQFYGYALPIADPPGAPADGYVSVLAQRVRTNFKAQNLELNVIRFPMCDMCSGGCNSGCNGGCDACGANGGYAYTGCDTCGCEEQCCPSAFSMYGSAGVRYFRVDDDFMYASEFTEWVAAAPDQGAYDGFTYDNSNELYYDVQVENHFVGPQVGWTTNYCYNCKWNFFCNSTFGLFNNHIEHYQRMFSGGDGTVRFTGDGRTFVVNSTKDDISFLGELRLGGSYDISCHWCAVAAYRAVAMAGIATSTDQIPEEFTNKEWVAIIDSDNSMIIHGLQLGAECRY